MSKEYDELVEKVACEITPLRYHCRFNVLKLADIENLIEFTRELLSTETDTLKVAVIPKGITGQMFSEPILNCAGCGKKREGPNRTAYRIYLRDGRKIESGITHVNAFCEIKCLKKWLKKQ